MTILWTSFVNGPSASCPSSECPADGVPEPAEEIEERRGGRQRGGGGQRGQEVLEALEHFRVSQFSMLCSVVLFGLEVKEKARPRGQ